MGGAVRTGACVMIRETFGPAVDDALARLDVAGVPREATAAIRARLRRDKRVVAAAIGLLEAWDNEGAVTSAFRRLREAIAALPAREGVQE